MAFICQNLHIPFLFMINCKIFMRTSGNFYGKFKVLAKLTLFMWCSLANKMPSWANLTRICFQGTKRCMLYAKLMKYILGLCSCCVSILKVFGNML